MAALACLCFLIGCNQHPTPSGETNQSDLGSTSESKGQSDTSSTLAPDSLPPPSGILTNNPSSKSDPDPLQTALLSDGSKELVIPLSEFGSEATFNNGVIRTVVVIDGHKDANAMLETACANSRFTGTAVRIPLEKNTETQVVCRTLQTGVGIKGDGNRIDQAGIPAGETLSDLNKKVVTDFEEVHSKAAASMVSDIKQEIDPHTTVAAADITLALTEDLMDQIRTDQLDEIPAGLRSELKEAPPRQSPPQARQVAHLMTDPSIQPAERRAKIRAALGMIE